MKEFLDIFIFKPKRTERMIIFVLKASFAFCYAIWIYKYLGFADIVDQITDMAKLKHFLFDGHFILFIFLFLLLYFVFFKFSTVIFSAIGMISMWLANIISKIILNVLVFVLAVIFWLPLKGFKYRPFWKIIDTIKPLNDIGNLIKWVFLKVGVLKSPEQKIHSSKDAAKILKELRAEIVENGDRIYTKIHTRFVFGILLYGLYFYYLHPGYDVHYVDQFIFYFCLITVFLQLLTYWAYNHFRIIYYIYLLGYRDIHRQEIYMKSLSELLNRMELDGSQNCSTIENSGEMQLDT